MERWKKIAFILTIVGAINWGLIGFFQFDLVATLFGAGNMDTILPRIIYSLMGIAGISCIPLLNKRRNE
ncbi:DUF378 domain-containing protein [Gracilibacillus sp. YIM 98692]|uniref:DUF378 domain-containing protein n=1 Tax=Gracilibacillus sp. YIM 98692 TaxID=2663532 RepID=UPI0013D355D2|nr:DUF378 domain-containing protein [Gracilibacillus sp. YIM 98692]